jgi:hypothetical protein
MNKTELGTINGKSVDSEMIANLSEKFEQDWNDDEVTVKPTNYANALAALRNLDLSVGVIEALERRAKNQREPLQLFLRSVLQNELMETKI